MTTARLTPTQDLILEVLAARHRLGEPNWPFDYRHKPALNGLQNAGLIAYGPAITAHLRASLTDAGRAEYTSATYRPPLVERANALGHLLTEARQRIRHDHAYPMDIGHHHCPGCDLEAAIDKTLGAQA